MYLGFALALLGAWWFMGSLSAGVGCIGFFLAAQYWYIPFEEKRCLDVFGDDYKTYQQAVRRWL
jgi:protein-S-isoprenylcysteine O-methyltransferase Ste14